MNRQFFFLLVFFIVNISVHSQNKCSVIAYYAGDANSIDAYPVEKLTHIIYSFCHLKDNRLSVDNKKDSLTIQKLVSLRERNAGLKIILSLGGWGGCAPCSQVFSTNEGRMAFAQSVKELNKYFNTNGIDLDWEYPAIEGYPGHQFLPQDKHNFTLLLQLLRQGLGSENEISFAAGGFTKFLEQSIEWNEVMPLVDKVNLMTYDLINGNSTVTGHHTPLYSTPQQKESCDNAVRYLDSIGFPKNKLVIGAAFYARVFDVYTNGDKGLYQPGKFNHGIAYNEFDEDALQKEGFTYYWDDVAKAPYMYSAGKKKVITFDNKKSLALKTKYALDQKLNGIMFWELGNDKTTNGLLNAIDDVLKGTER